MSAHYTRINPPVFNVTSSDDVVRCMDLPVVQRKVPFGGGLPIETTVEPGEAENILDSETASNPARWNNNFPKKMQDMQFFFSCGPLRVSSTCPKHWDRLHAAHRSVMPLPGGRLEKFEVRVPHTSDEALASQVCLRERPVGDTSSGTVQCNGKLGGVIPKRDIDTPILQHLLRSTYVPPLPVRPNSNDPIRIKEERIRRSAGYVAEVVSDDGSSVFSSTTVASKPAVVSQATPGPQISLSCGDRQNAEIGINSAVGSSRSASVAAKSVSSVRSSKLSTLQRAIQQERNMSDEAQERIRAASAQLDELEKILKVQKRL